jgi:hypothetical protein
LSETGTCGAIPITLAPKSSCTLGITFEPASLGAHSATLTMTDNATTSPQHCELSGTGTVTLTVSTTSLTFGDVKFGTDCTKTFSVTNHQTQPVSLSESFSGKNHADFSVVGGTCTASLAARSTCRVEIGFKPGALGTESATLKIADSPDPLGPYAIAISTGPTIPDTVMPAALAFGDVEKSKTKTLSNLKVSNLSPFKLTLSERIAGANAKDFTVTPVSSCAGNSVCAISVSFEPSTDTAEKATLTVNVGSDPTSPHSVKLTGRGVSR